MIELFIIGHRVTEADSIIKMVNQKSQIISIDNGCKYRNPHKIFD